MMLVNITIVITIYYFSCKEGKSNKPSESLQGPVPDRRPTESCPAHRTGPESGPAGSTHDVTLVALVNLAPHSVSTHWTLQHLLEGGHQDPLPLLPLLPSLYCRSRNQPQHLQAGLDEILHILGVRWILGGDGRIETGRVEVIWDWRLW